MRVLVIGSGGMLGYVTFRYLKDCGHRVVGLTGSKTLPGMRIMNAADEYVIGGYLHKESFDAVINCAALLLGPSEERKCEAIRLNTWLPHYLEEYCTQRRAYLIQVSTDAVFSGTRGGYGEEDLTDADTFYGKSKLLGEVNSDCALTVRSGFWGLGIDPKGAGLLQWFLRQETRVSGYTRAVFNGVSNLEFAGFAERALQNRWTGIYHLCAARPLSKYDFLRLAGQVFSKDTEVVQDGRVCIDRSLRTVRADIPYRQKTFAQMMDELRDIQLRFDLLGH